MRVDVELKGDLASRFVRSSGRPSMGEVDVAMVARLIGFCFEDRVLMAMVVVIRCGGLTCKRKIRLARV